MENKETQFLVDFSSQESIKKLFEKVQEIVSLKDGINSIDLIKIYPDGTLCGQVDQYYGNDYDLHYVYHYDFI